jgi:hypothetical protein
MRVPTEAGDLWFKANMPVQAYEAGVVRILARRRPDLLPDLLAVDLERGWMLQTDGGTLLRDLVEGNGDHDAWLEILPLYAELQMDAVADSEELVAAGAPDRRLAVLPRQFEELLADPEELGELTDEELVRLQDLVPVVDRDARELAAYGLPETIQHDDLHDGQIFVREGGYVFFDWGDSCVSHPFYTLVVTLAVLAHRLGLEQDAPELDRFRDAYLESWTHLSAREDGGAAFAIAYRLGVLCRGLTWARVTAALPRPLEAQDADAVPERMRMLLGVYGG